MGKLCILYRPKIHPTATGWWMKGTQSDILGLLSWAKIRVETMIEMDFVQEHWPDEPDESEDWKRGKER